MGSVPVFAVNDEAGADQPVGMIDPAGEPEPAGKPVAADRGGDPLRIERGRHDGFGVFIPQVFLRLQRERAQHLGVIAHNHHYPALGAVAPRQVLHHAAQHAPAHRVAAEPFRLGHADQPGIAKRLQRFRRYAAVLFRRRRRRRKFPQDRLQGFRPRLDFGGVRTRMGGSRG